MQITSMFPFFFLMAIFVAISLVLCRKLSPYNLLVPELLHTKGYYLELESMRGLLALAVVVHHALVYYFLLYEHTPVISGPHSNFYLQLGTAPVTFFFFITGFLFWSKLIAKPKQSAGKVPCLPPAPPGTGIFGWGSSGAYPGGSVLAFPAA